MLGKPGGQNVTLSPKRERTSGWMDAPNGSALADPNFAHVPIDRLRHIAEFEA
jgi:hypothetical protein